MKQNFFIQVLLGFSIVFSNVNCNKNPEDYEAPKPVEVNTAPTVNAGIDMMVFAPSTQVTLFGLAEDKESNIAHYKWRKVEGPLSYTFSDSTRLLTQVTNLVKGYYAFELTVTDSLGLQAKSLVRLAVLDVTSSPNEIILRDVVWSCTFECGIEINNYTSQIPASSTITVFIRRDNSNNWTLVGDQDVTNGFDYLFMTTNGNLYLMTGYLPGDSYLDTPDIKIVY
jgi:hypothetical protein